jgi:hypothetical protein
MFRKLKMLIGLMDKAISIFYWKIISGKKIMHRTIYLV